MKSLLTIQKELLKEEYAKSPLGIAEKKLRAFHDEAYLKSNPIPEEMMKQIDEIRKDFEKRQEDYVEMTLKRDKEAVDDMLLKAFNKELALLETLNRTTDMNDE